MEKAEKFLSQSTARKYIPVSLSAGVTGGHAIVSHYEFTKTIRQFLVEIGGKHFRVEK